MHVGCWIQQVTTRVGAVTCWIQQVTTRVGAVTCWIQQPVSPKQVVGFSCVFNKEILSIHSGVHDSRTRPRFLTFVVLISYQDLINKILIRPDISMRDSDIGPQILLDYSILQ